MNGDICETESLTHPVWFDTQSEKHGYTQNKTKL